MNQHLTKLVLSTTVVSALGSSAFAQAPQNTAAPSFEQGYGLSDAQFPPAYNAAARIDVEQDWDLFFTGSFIYWMVDEDGFQLAIDLASSPLQEQLFQSNAYSPGFKVGIGMNFNRDHWVGSIEYTWLRNRSSYSNSSTDLEHSNLIIEGISGPIASVRRVNLDLIDATLSRPFYEGRALTLFPYSGLRGAWLRQNFRLATSPSSDNTHSNINSWFIGPNTGLAMHWLLGYGIRLESDAGISLLFEQYESNLRLGSYIYKADEQNRLAPVMNLNLGIGWGTYLDRQKMHLDFLATYDFMNWWGQNLIRALADSSSSNAFGPQPSDLQISGLTLTGRFDF